MTAVVREYSRGQDEITSLRQALLETKSVLTAKKSGQLAMKDLWLKKKELDETMRILKDLEWLKDSPLRIHRLIQQKRYYNAVGRLNKALERMFSDDLVDVTGLGGIREQLLELKGRILDDILSELRNDVVGRNVCQSLFKALEEGEASDEDSDSLSEEKSASVAGKHRPNNNSYNYDAKSVFSSETNYNVSPSTAGLTSMSTLPFSDASATGLLAVDESVEMSIPDIVSSG